MKKVHSLSRGEAQRRRRLPQPRKRASLITGGAGFIGANLAARLAGEGRDVLIYDNLSRPGVEENLIWLRRSFGDRISVEVADIRDAEALGRAVSQASEVYHFAAQVAVTTSVVHPLEDFEINARGTLNLLEALRRLPCAPPLFYTSTNKVYGKLEGYSFAEEENAFRPISEQLAQSGVPESQPLDFYSPYGCSKGTAEQYVRDYARIYGLPTVVFRMSCIYGPLQRGTEDQGWVAHFLIRALRGDSITLYGNGKQVRDILFVDDLLDAFALARAEMPKLKGEIFNLGGGPTGKISLLDLIARIEALEGRPVETIFGPWRPGDQPYYVSDIGRFSQRTGWRPRIDVQEGIARLHAWLRASLPKREIPTLSEFAFL